MSERKALLRWQLGRWRRRLGWPGLAGTALIGFALVFYAAADLPAHFKADDLQKRARAAAAAKPAGAAAQTPEARLAQFDRNFPARDTAPEWLEKIYAAGAQSALTLDKGEYKLNPDRNAGLARYEVSLPVRGGYVHIRQFIRAVLTELPFAALSDVQFRRTKVGEPEVEAVIRFTLFLRETA